MSFKFQDSRGTIICPLNKNTDFKVKDCTVSINKKDVFRGIHINSFAKLVTCISGRVLDIVINFDKESDDYLKPKYYHLDPETEMYQVLVPENCGHAFLSLEDNSTIVYLFNEKYQDGDTKFIHYQDPTIGLNLPIDNPILSEKDQEQVFLDWCK